MVPVLQLHNRVIHIATHREWQDESHRHLGQGENTVAALQEEAPLIPGTLMLGGAMPPRAVTPRTISRSCSLLLAGSRGSVWAPAAPSTSAVPGRTARKPKGSSPSLLLFSSDLPSRGRSLTLISSLASPTLWKRKVADSHATSAGLPHL